MDLFTAIKERRSCRDFSSEQVDEETIQAILEAAAQAPSPMNAQPWEFIVITKDMVKEKIYSEAERCCKWAMEKSGWKWLGKYRMDFLKTAPVLIAITGDPQKSGVDMFMEGGGAGYQHACAAAIQNMLLAAHALGLGSLWFTMFDRGALGDILEIEAGKVPLALVCIGKVAGECTPIPRKDIEKKTTYIR